MNIGDKFGRLTVVSEKYKPDPTKYQYFVECECSCGSGVRPYRCVSLTKKTAPTLSCGCLQKESASTLKTEVIGKTFSRLTVTHDLGMQGKRRMVLAECSCGTKNFKVRFDKLQNDHTKSCGCLYEDTRGVSTTTHGMAGTPEYRSWQAMKERCRNPKAPGYENYGGRGITYNPSWELFENFYRDMGARAEGTELDRIDVNGNYCKENCRWADSTTQSFNRRKRSGTSSKYSGLSLRPNGTWDVRLCKEGILVFRATFYSELESAKAYDEACLGHYGVRKNFPDGN